MERKALFAQYVEVQREVEREEERQNALRAQEAFRELLRATPAITSATRYSEALELLGRAPAFLALDNPRDRAAIFDQHIAELHREETEQNRQRKRRMVEKYRRLLQDDLKEAIGHTTTWRVALPLIQARISELGDNDLSSMELMDLLVGFENHIKDLERVAQRSEAAAREAQRQKERRARAAFKRLLAEMETRGVLTATCDWSRLYARIKDRAEFRELLGCAGSTPLDLFWDRLHVLQEQYVAEAAPIVGEWKASGNNGWMESEEALLKATKGVSPSLELNLRRHLFPSREDPQGLLSPERRAQLAPKVDEYRRTRRRQIDRLKSLIKHFDPPIQLDSSYAQVGPLIAARPEGAEVADDEIRLYYFDKYIRHLRKKAGLETGNDEADD